MWICGLPLYLNGNVPVICGGTDSVWPYIVEESIGFPHFSQQCCKLVVDFIIRIPDEEQTLYSGAWNIGFILLFCIVVSNFWEDPVGLFKLIAIIGDLFWEELEVDKFAGDPTLPLEWFAPGDVDVVVAFAQPESTELWLLAVCWVPIGIDCKKEPVCEVDFESGLYRALTEVVGIWQVSWRLCSLVARVNRTQVIGPAPPLDVVDAEEESWIPGEDSRKVIILSKSSCVSIGMRN